MEKQPSDAQAALFRLASKIKKLLQEHSLCFIDDPSAFKKEYDELIHKTKHTFDFNPFETPVSVFNTEEIAGPRLEKEGLVIFYANDSKKIPYKVTVGDRKSTTKIEMLPLL